MKLTATNVESLFISCLFAVSEDSSNPLIVEGVKQKVGFDPKRIEQNKTEIETLLSQCEPTFFDTSEGKGWTFLNFCQDKNGELWTGVHRICDHLICLGLAIGKVNFLLPRELWDALPGGVPYLQITGVNK